MAYYVLKVIMDLMSYGVRIAYLEHVIIFAYLVKQIDNTYITLIVLTISFKQIMFFLKVYKDFGKFVHLLTICIREMQAFIFFIVLWIFFFSLYYHVAGVEFDDGDYPSLSPYFVLLI